METIKSDTEGGFNAFIDEQRTGSRRRPGHAGAVRHRLRRRLREPADRRGPAAGAAAAGDDRAVRRARQADHRRRRRAGRHARRRAARQRGRRRADRRARELQPGMDPRRGQRGDPPSGTRVLLGFHVPRRQHGCRRDRRSSSASRPTGRSPATPTVGRARSTAWRSNARATTCRAAVSTGGQPRSQGFSDGGPRRLPRRPQDSDGRGQARRAGRSGRPSSTPPTDRSVAVDDGTVKVWKGIRYAARTGRLSCGGARPSRRSAWSEPADATTGGAGVPAADGPEDPDRPRARRRVTTA